jgi:hypothetical protein
MEKVANFLETFIFTTLPNFIFGVRNQGEKIQTPTFKSSYPENQPPQFDWFNEFRGSSLHTVQQMIYLD